MQILEVQNSLLICNHPFAHFFNALVGDTITALEYSSTGEYLATGDRNGRITVLRMDMEAKAQVK
jgi:hypothetical protein